MKRTTTVIAAGLVLAAALPTAPAHALVARTFVSAAGSDSNNCANVATPCRHFAAAYAATAADGEIYVLDPANYGSLTITGPVSIEGHGWASIAPVAGQAAITISANPGDNINIVGVVLDGTNLANTNGIQFNAAGRLSVRDSIIRNFSGTGIYFVPNANSKLIVSNTLVADNGSDGISVFPTNAGAFVEVALNRVEANNNGNNGIGMNSSRSMITQITATASDSVAAGNTGAGFIATTLPGAGASFVDFNLFHCVAASNGTGIMTNGSRANVFIAQTSLDVNEINTWDLSGGGTLNSYGDNYADSPGVGSVTSTTKF